MFDTLVDACRFGTPWKKPIKMWHSNFAWCVLGLRRCCKTKHVHLRGFGTVLGRKTIMTKAAGAYAPMLVSKWVSLEAAQVQPSSIWKKDDWTAARLELLRGLPLQ
ncbi:unnamed protein product [Polarella glacialis]|uniref:Uncharacterized protein n=1 Tax=Polarella glacialis TaxID=89957 RepID=A0A813KAY1_POLGL|nr:unnamed protein product [Polarella glacialis]CAE8697078.1 unnamed protein product [Polarella glacialis]